MLSITSTIVSALGLYAHVASAQGQGNPIQIPEITGVGNSGGSGCDGCYVVADVAGIAFGTETVTAIQTNQVIVQNGLNGTYTTTSAVLSIGEFTFGPNGLAPAPTGGPTPVYNTQGTTLVISGLTLTSPTVYNVFTAYSVTSSVFTNGACRMVPGTSSNLANAFSVAIPPGADLNNFQSEAQQSFVNFIGKPTCSLASVDFSPITQTPVDISTTAVTSTNTARVTPMPASLPGQTYYANRTTLLPSGSGAATYTSIHQASGSRMSAFGSLFAGAMALIAGIAA